MFHARFCNFSLAPAWKRLHIIHVFPEDNVMQGILYEESFFILFLIVSCLIGGWAAWMTGRGCALTWRKPFMALLYMIPLGAAIRFIHFSVFNGTLMSLHYYSVDTLILMIFCLLGFQYTRTRQMIRQYSWLYEKSSPVSWRRKRNATHATGDEQDCRNTF